MLPKTYRKLIADHFSNNFREAAKIVETELKPPTGFELTIRNRYAGVNATDVNTFVQQAFAQYFSPDTHTLGDPYEPTPRWFYKDGD